VLVNDRVDVYHALRVQGVAVAGVHVGQSDVPVGVVRDLVGPDAVVGLTAHRSEHLADLAAMPAGTADYLGVGALRATSTKGDHPPARGLAGLAAVWRATPTPCVAIGGIRPADVAGLRASGAAGVAVVSGICAAPDPRSAAARLRAEWDR
jgi:thiamine-phosphate pyrophosphorylase